MAIALFSDTLTKKHLYFMSFKPNCTKLDCELRSTITVPIISDGIILKGNNRKFKSNQYYITIINLVILYIFINSSVILLIIPSYFRF